MIEGGQRPQRRAGPVRGRHRPAHRARRDRPRRGAGAVPDDRRLAARASTPRSTSRFELREWTDAAEASPDTDIARIAVEAVRATTGTAPDLVGFTGITDARFYINEARIPTVICGPGSLTVAHTADEWVPVDELVAGATGLRTHVRCVPSA